MEFFCCIVSVCIKRSNPVLMAAATRLDRWQDVASINRMNDAGFVRSYFARSESQLHKRFSSIITTIETIRMHVYSWLAFSLMLLAATSTTASDCSVSIESPQVRLLQRSIQPIFLNLATSTSLVSTTTTSASPSSSPSPRM